MRWTKIAWNEISAKIIQNCWIHTKIILLRNETGILITVPINVNDIKNTKENLTEELIIKELQKQIDLLCVYTSIPIKNWINSEDEQKIHQQFTNDDFIQ
ncbi:14448_t:CDS:1, partial [Acaulospora morrowiae]